MLVLSREIKETIVIKGETGEEICSITVNSIRGRRVGLAFEADKKIRIMRKELLEAKVEPTPEKEPVSE